MPIGLPINLRLTEDQREKIEKAHDQNTDTALDHGEANAVTAAELVTLRDTTVPAKADKVVGATNNDIAGLDGDGDLKSLGSFKELLETSLATAIFSYDSNTTSPAASIARTVPTDFIEWLNKHMRGCVVDDDGVVAYYLKDTDWSEKEDGTASVLTGEDGQVCVQVPAFYCKLDVAGTVQTWTVSSGHLPGLQLHPAFIKDGVQVKYRYIGAYDACVEKDTPITATIATSTEDDPVVVNTDGNHNLVGKGPVVITSTGIAELDDISHIITITSDTQFTIDGLDGTDIGEAAAGTATQTYVAGQNLDDNSTNVNTDNDKMASVKDVYPMVGLYRSQFRPMARNRGTFWRQLDYMLVEAVRMLYLVEYQTFFNQDELGDGNTEGSYVTTATNATQAGSPHTIAGAGDSIGSGSTDSISGAGVNAKPGTSFMKYRGIENFFGNCWNWADGVNINVGVAGRVHVSNNAADFADDVDTNYTLITSSLTTGSANIQSFLPVEGFFLAATTGGSDSQYVTDRHYGSATVPRVLRVGGSAHFAGVAGVFAATATLGSDARARPHGSRLAG